MKNTRWLRHLVFFTQFFLSFVGEYLSIPLRGSQHIAPILCSGGNETAMILPLRFHHTTGRIGWMSPRKWKEAKQQPSMLPGPAVPGCCLISFHFLWAIRAVCLLFLVFPISNLRKGAVSCNAQSINPSQVT